MSQQPADLDVLPAHWEIVQAILWRQVPEYEVWAFGSRTQGNARVYSDLDLVIVTAQPLSLDRLAALKEAFSESDLPWKVDVLDWATLSANFQQRVARSRIVIQKPAGATGVPVS